jgi:hypothetical protein
VDSLGSLLWFAMLFRSRLAFFASFFAFFFALFFFFLRFFSLFSRRFNSFSSSVSGGFDDWTCSFIDAPSLSATALFSSSSSAAAFSLSCHLTNTKL